MEQRIPTDDIYMAAYLNYRGHQPELELNRSGKNVTFIFPASMNILNAMGDYGANPDVPLHEFVNSLKTVRAKMLSKRNEYSGGDYGQR